MVSSIITYLINRIPKELAELSRRDNLVKEAKSLYESVIQFYFLSLIHCEGYSNATSFQSGVA